MKVEVSETQLEKKQRVYPWIGVTKNPRDEQEIVLFTAKGHGVVLVSNSPRTSRGYLSACWCEENFKEFTGTITLSND